ncbi:N-acetyltransferase family protein [Paenibacillus spiritus]|uniref:N-acetyltransferase family protein n=1 Tax=Paenibacillus spiritus TaxID=2496557 RepID=A0A5J5GIK8_9BACL|nr:MULTISPECIES: arsinothricin resistance N-acetyltransferase ArsN1 family A [Paenibacillus]KAA9007553.1 N-acetyltransferase family protein [Paenibacillus spiritus]
MEELAVRRAAAGDIEDLLHIYNQGIEDRIATLEEEIKDLAYMKRWMEEHQGRHAVLVAERNGLPVGWASLNPYSHRCAYRGVADLSVYIRREYRGQGVGSLLLQALEEEARLSGFRKIILFTFPFNNQGQGLYRKMKYREVGIFENQGLLDGAPIDVMIMEKLL